MFEHLQNAHKYFIIIFSAIEEYDDSISSVVENKPMYTARTYFEVAVKAF